MNDEELALRIEVHGTPIPQPRPRFVDGRAVSTAGPRAKRWKHAVIQACEEAAIVLGEAAIEQIGGIGDAEGGRGGGFAVQDELQGHWADSRIPMTG